MERLSFWLTRLAVEIFRWMPFWLLYKLSEVLAFVLRRVVSYRRRVAIQNLQRAFPGLSAAEMAVLLRAVYRNLSDIVLETLKSYTLPLTEIQRRSRPVNPEVVNRHLDAGKCVILCGGHYANWEYTGISMPPLFHGTTITVFKPISNRYLNAYVNSSRSRAGMQMISMEETLAAMQRCKRQAIPAVFILLADQSPSNRKGAHWVRFLGQETASLPGVDVLARRMKFPVVFFWVERKRRGFYEVHFADLNDKPENAAEGEITQAFARALENVIRQKPENWLWTHRRWKIEQENSTSRGALDITFPS
ncbi:MAG: lysophospholipid acyltransferase family protein [Saprospiraceae bacterium]|nr:lysophospholipid acyltransferase family protein [Saprospiraceae bacterium]MDW8484672.1 lysophospholipid acyltransferase family protein [Saprospiraceae bacterium]